MKNTTINEKKKEISGGGFEEFYRGDIGPVFEQGEEVITILTSSEEKLPWP